MVDFDGLHAQARAARGEGRTTIRIELDDLEALLGLSPHLLAMDRLGIAPDVSTINAVRENVKRAHDLRLSGDLPAAIDNLTLAVARLSSVVGCLR